MKLGLVGLNITYLELLCDRIARGALLRKPLLY